MLNAKLFLRFFHVFLACGASYIIHPELIFCSSSSNETPKANVRTIGESNEKGAVPLTYGDAPTTSKEKRARIVWENKNTNEAFSQVINEFIALLNGFRLSGANDPSICTGKVYPSTDFILTYDELLSEAALRHVTDMAENNFLGLTGSDGSDTKTRVEEAGFISYSSWYAAESPAASLTLLSAEHLLSNFLGAEQDYCNQFLYPDFNSVGMAIIKSENINSTFGYYYSIILARDVENPCGDVTLGFDYVTNCTDLDVVFTNISSGASPDASYLWDLGDGTQIEGFEGPSHSYGEEGTYLVTLTVEEQDCRRSYSKNVFVEPEPVPTHNEFDLICEPSGSIILTGGFPSGGTYSGAFVSNGTFDSDAPGQGIFDSDASGEGTFDITYTVVFPNGCEGSVTRALTIGDPVPPVVRVKNISLSLDPNGQTDLSVNQIDDGSSDNCGIAEMYLDRTNFTEADLGENQVNLTVVDNSGNTSAQEATVYVYYPQDHVVINDFYELFNDLRLNGLEDPLLCTGKPYGPTTSVEYSEKLENAALRHAADMAENDFYGLTGSDGSSTQDRVSEAGFTNVGWTVETIAYSSTLLSAYDLLYLFLESEFDYCNQFFYPSHNRIGMAIVKVPYTGSPTSYRYYYSFVLASEGGEPVVSVPDANFEQALIDLGIDSDGTINQQLLRNDAEAVTSLDLHDPPNNPIMPNVQGKIQDLTGIEAFINLTALNATFNELAFIHLGNNVLLKSVNLTNNLLTDLDLTNNTALTLVSVDNNLLTALNLSTNVQLQSLYCSGNALTSLDLSNNTQLHTLYTYGNQLTALDVSNNPLLTTIRCETNAISSLDLSRNAALLYLFCYGNQLTELDLGKNPALRYLACQNNAIASLDLSMHPNLSILRCSGNGMTYLNVRNGNNQSLTLFDATDNALTCINVDNELDDHVIDCEVNPTGSCQPGPWKVDEGVAFSNNCSYNTQLGTEVFVTDGTLYGSVTFQEVSGSGQTTLQTATTVPTIPGGYAIGEPPLYFDITTTATYNGSIKVCLYYGGMGSGDQDHPSLLHYEEGQWTDFTTEVDVENMWICGEVTSLSPFAIVLDVAPPVFGPTKDILVQNAPGAAGAVVNFDIPTATDNGPSVTVGQVDGTGLSSGSFFPVGTTELLFRATDMVGNTSELMLDVTVVDAAPTIDDIVGPEAPVALSTAIGLDIHFTDDNIALATVDWGDGSVDVTEGPPGGIISWGHTYASAGVYSPIIELTDLSGSTATTTYQYIVVFDPDGGFVTGGGWIWSGPGSYIAAPDLEGRANFGFVAKYRKGVTVPIGDTEFQFHTGGMDFRSTSYEWLVVAGDRAIFKGEGTINGSGIYGFQLSAMDGDRLGTADLFRIKIWSSDLVGDEEMVSVVYDSQPGEANDADVRTPIGGGAIVVHDGKGGKDKQDVAERTSLYYDNPEAGKAGNVAVYPNPFRDRISIHLDGPFTDNGPVIARLYSGDGKVVFAEKLTQDINEVLVLEVGTLPTGLYVLTLDNGMEMLSFKLTR